MTEYPSRRDPKVVITAIAVVVVIIIATVAVIMFNPVQQRTLTVYTYGSFMDWGDDNDTAFFAPFEERYDVDVIIDRRADDANTLVAILEAESANPIADVVIGIDNILILEQAARSVLEPYTPTNLSLIDESIVTALDPEHYVVPFDFGLVTIIYSMADMNTTTHPELANLTFADLADPAMASALVTEDPYLSSPGLAFLLTEIAVHEKLLGTDWTDWWSDVKNDIDIQPGWSEAWGVWYSDPTKHMMVSYGTDPAYSAYYTQAEPDVGTAPIYYGGEHYAWMQVEGMGLVKNGPNPELAKLFIEYCLSPAVQKYVALNQWMFPANMNVELNSAFDFALKPDEVVLLNELLGQAEIEENLASWKSEWNDIIRG